MEINKPACFKSDDQFSNLHDDILVKIISHLPIGDMVRTSAVSRRWARLWTLSRRLDLRCRKLGHPMHRAARKRLTEARLRTSTAARAPRTCLISLHKDRRADQGLIDNLRQKRIESLTINACSYGGVSVAVPREIFSISSLQELAIDNCEVDNGAYFSHLVNLRSLRLRKVTVSGHQLSAAVSRLPCLERLLLSKIQTPKEIEIRSETLRQLEIGVMELETLKIDAPGLTILAVDVVVGKFTIRAPALRVLKTNPMCIDDESSQSETKSRSKSGIEFLELLSGIYKPRFDHAIFSSLTKLSITLNLNDMRQTVVLAYVMTECLALQHLDIRAGKEVMLDSEHSCLPYSNSEFWRKQTICSSLGCIPGELEHVSIRDFTGEPLELEFVRFLITKAAALRKLVIWHQCSDICLEGLMYLLSLNLPRASTDLSIVLHPEVNEWKTENLLSRFYRDWLSLVDDE